MDQVIETPKKTILGARSFDQVGREGGRLGKKCLLVTGRQSMRRHGFIDAAVTQLARNDVATVVFEGVEHDPHLSTVDELRALFRDEECDFVFGLGGGSTIDAAKAAAGLSQTDRPTREFFDGAAMPEHGCPVMAAPSTFGTGTEATRVAVLTDPERRLKKSIRHDCMLPQVAIVDPALGVSAPPSLTAACGLDALTQGVESYLSRHAYHETESISLDAIRLMLRGLEPAVEDGENMEARENCAKGSYLAGIALHNARLGLVHGLAHPLGVRYGLAHGYVCGILLPVILDYNHTTNPQKYAKLESLFGGAPATMCRQLLVRLGLPTDLRNIEIPRDDFEELADMTLPSGSTKANPRDVTREDVVQLLLQLC